MGNVKSMGDVFFDFRGVSFSYEEAENQDTEYEKRDKKIKLDDTVIRNRVFAVNDLQFTVAEGEFVAVIGRNGSGKSTVARLMNGLLLPEKGVVYVENISTAEEEHIWEVRKNVGMVFQNPDNQIIGTTVEEDVAFGPENLGVPHDEMVRRVYAAIDTVGLTENRDREPHLLSGGQKQRVAIAGILAMEPKCIVLDEATAMLDPIGRREVMNVILQLNREKHITVVLITHHMDEVAAAQRAILIDQGHIVADAPPKEVFSNVEMMRDAGLEVPQVTQLFDLLRKAGYNVPADVISVEEACLELKRFLEE